MTCAYNVSSLQVHLTVSSELYHLWADQMDLCLRYNRPAAPVPFRRLLVLWLTLQQEESTGWTNIVLSPDLSGCLGAGYTCSAVLLFLGVEECHCLLVACQDTHRVQLELTTIVRRNGRHLLHLYLRR